MNFYLLVSVGSAIASNDSVEALRHVRSIKVFLCYSRFFSKISAVVIYAIVSELSSLLPSWGILYQNKLLNCVSIFHLITRWSMTGSYNQKNQFFHLLLLYSEAHLLHNVFCGRGAIKATRGISLYTGGWAAAIIFTGFSY